MAIRKKQFSVWMGATVYGMLNSKRNSAPSIQIKCQLYPNYHSNTVWNVHYFLCWVSHSSIFSAKNWNINSNFFPGKYVDWVKEQRQLQEEMRIRSTVISKKQLDTKELERRRKPLQKLDEENERKKRKQKQRSVCFVNVSLYNFWAEKRWANRDIFSKMFPFLKKDITDIFFFDI